MENKNYLNEEVDKILKCSDYQYPLNIAMVVSWLILQLKGDNLKVLDMKKNSSLSDFFILANAKNHIQAEAIIDIICMQMKRKGYKIKSKEAKIDCNLLVPN